MQWTTHGHTAVDVNLYAYGPGTDELRGSHENTDIGDFISNYLQLDLAAVTHKLHRQVVTNIGVSKRFSLCRIVTPS